MQMNSHIVQEVDTEDWAFRKPSFRVWSRLIVSRTRRDRKLKSNDDFYYY